MADAVIEAGVGSSGGADARFWGGKPLGTEAHTGDASVPPLGVWMAARKAGVLTQSREGLGDSLEQVVGHRPAGSPVLLGKPRESSRLADRVVVARMSETTDLTRNQEPVVCRTGEHSPDGM